MAMLNNQRVYIYIAHLRYSTVKIQELPRFQTGFATFPDRRAPRSSGICSPGNLEHKKHAVELRNFDVHGQETHENRWQCWWAYFHFWLEHLENAICSRKTDEHNSFIFLLETIYLPFLVGKLMDTIVPFLAGQLRNIVNSWGKSSMWWMWFWGYLLQRVKKI